MYEHQRNHRSDEKRSRTFFFLFIFSAMCIFNACSPYSQYARLLRNHPYLKEVRDSISIRHIEDKDTTFVFSKETDTIYFNDTKLYRTSDTIRLVRTFQPCTTFIRTEQTLPIKETRIERERWKIRETWIEQGILVLLILLLLITLMKR